MTADRRVFSREEQRAWERLQVDALDRILQALSRLQWVRIDRNKKGEWEATYRNLQNALRHAESLTPPDEWGTDPEEMTG